LKALERLGNKGDMNGHGSRALAMTTLKERLGYRHEVVDRQLAHAQKDKLKHVDRARYLEERMRGGRVASGYSFLNASPGAMAVIASA
jgi:hypothetical protein